MRANFNAITVLPAGSTLSTEAITTSPVSVSLFGNAAFALALGEGAGKYTVTAEAVDSATEPTIIQPVEFSYKVDNGDESFAPLTGITVAGGKEYTVFVANQALASIELSLVRLKLEQAEAGDLDACIIAILSSARY